MFKKMFSLSIIFGFHVLCAMEKVKGPELRQLMTKLVTQLMPTVDPIVVEQGFGDTFNFYEFLHADKVVTVSDYKRRLKDFKRYLFDYVEGYERPCGSQVEKSGSVLEFLKDYLKAAITLRETANSIPHFNGQPVVHFIPEKAITIPYLKIRIPEGAIGIIPHIEQKNGLMSVSTKVPVYVINDPEAESICLTLTQLNMSNTTPSEKASRAIELLKKKEPLSDQAMRILGCFIYNLCGENLDNLVRQTKQKAKCEWEEKKALKGCCINCPHILALEVLMQRLIRCPRNFLDRNADGIVSFSRAPGLLFAEVQRYLAVLNLLSKEYGVIYLRVCNELKKHKNKPAKVKDEKPKPIIVPPLIPKIIHDKINYAQRALCWFNKNFAKKKKAASVYYHTVLPIIADTIVINHGERSYYDNKTYKGQSDDLYTIGGKIINDETNEESYYVFNLCLDPQGICYHRDAKKCTWEQLAPALKECCTIDDVECEDDYEETDGLTINKPTIVQETHAFATIYNPMHKCKIILYKKQL